MTRQVKSETQLDFELWAKAHKFRCEWDMENRIYESAFTQAAWMAFEEGERQGREWQASRL